MHLAGGKLVCCFLFIIDVVGIQVMPDVFVSAKCPWVGLGLLLLLLLLQVFIDIINPSFAWMSFNTLCFRSGCGWVPECCFFCPFVVVHVCNAL